MFHNLYKFIIVLLPTVFFISCQKIELLDDIVFNNSLLEKININAESIKINNSYEYKISEPFIDHTMLITPSQRIESWLEDNVFIFGSNNQFIVKFESSQRAVTPGQFIVFYDKNICLGGGIINSVY